MVVSCHYGCLISIREVQARTLGRRTQLVSNGEEKWEVSQLLFADYTVLVVDSK